MTAAKPTAQYQAVRTDNGVHVDSYALELVSHICNNCKEVSSIDEPLPKYRTEEEEPDKERLIRLELRHRFYCAKSVQMPVVEFARKLVEDVWGGELIEEEVLVDNSEHKQPKEEQPEQQEAISHSNSNDSHDSSTHNSTPIQVVSEDYSHEEEEEEDDDNHSVMDVASATLQGMGDLDDDHMLFTTDQLEEDLNGAPVATQTNGIHELDRYELDLGDDGTLTAQTIDSSVPSLATAVTTTSSKRKRKPTTKALSTTTAPAPKHTKKAPKRRKKSPVKKHVEPLAPQVHSGSGRGGRHKMFTWADRMVQLADYKKEFGHIAIPTVRRDPYYNLGLWLAAQRSLYRKNSLRKDRLQDLRDLGCLGFGGPADKE